MRRAPILLEHGALVGCLAGCTGPSELRPSDVAVAHHERARFLAFGDAGTGADGQRAVAEAAQSVCASEGCDFVLYLGDTRYPDGFAGEDDPSFDTVFVEPYRALAVPFYVVMGNHDYGGVRGAGNEWEKAEVMRALGRRSEQWRFPDPAYMFEAGGVRFIALDTNRILYGYAADQGAWIDDLIAGADGPVVVFGHHPYQSAGSHGNAGAYEGMELVNWLPGARVTAGTSWRTFVEAHLCDAGVDLLLAGHDHQRMWMPPACGMELIVSGAGAKSVPLVPTSDALFGSDELGFLHVVIEGTEMVGTFYDTKGQRSYRRAVEVGP